MYDRRYSACSPGGCPRRPRLGPALCRRPWCPHQHAAGESRSRAIRGESTVEGVDEALGRNQSGFSTKLHLHAESGGGPITAVLTAGRRHEHFALDGLVEKGAVPRQGRGRPRLRPRRTAGDRGYASLLLHRGLKRCRTELAFPRRKNQLRQRNVDTTAYRERNKVERLINRL